MRGGAPARAARGIGGGLDPLKLERADTAAGREVSAPAARRPAARPAGRWLFVLNPVAGRGWCARHGARLRDAVAALGLDARFATTDAPGAAARLAREGVAAGADRIVAVGGDGTVHEIVCGLMQAGADAAGAAFGTLPVGTGNDFARTLAMPRGWRAGLAALARARAVPCDVGEAVFRRDGAPAASHFINVAGAGFDGVLLAGLGARRAGKWVYLIQLLKSWRAWVSPVFRYSGGGRAEAGARGVTVLFALGRYCGGGMEVAPGARLDSGAAEIVFVADLTGRELLMDLPKLFNGRIADSAHTVCWAAPALAVDTEPAMPVEADGELLGMTPAEFRVLPGALRVLVA